MIEFYRNPKPHEWRIGVMLEPGAPHLVLWLGPIDVTLSVGPLFPDDDQAAP
jgi:hypothetical protein